MVASSLGPNGMKKLVVNHLGKIIVSSDCATLVKEVNDSARGAWGQGTGAGGRAGAFLALRTGAME